MRITHCDHKAAILRSNNRLSTLLLTTSPTTTSVQSLARQNDHTGPHHNTTVIVTSMFGMCMCTTDETLQSMTPMVEEGQFVLNSPFTTINRPPPQIKRPAKHNALTLYRWVHHVFPSQAHIWTTNAPNELTFSELCVVLHHSLSLLFWVTKHLVVASTVSLMQILVHIMSIATIQHLRRKHLLVNILVTTTTMPETLSSITTTIPTTFKVQITMCPP